MFPTNNALTDNYVKMLRDRIELLVANDLAIDRREYHYHLPEYTDEEIKRFVSEKNRDITDMISVIIEDYTQNNELDLLNHLYINTQTEHLYDYDLYYEPLRTKIRLRIRIEMLIGNDLTCCRREQNLNEYTEDEIHQFIDKHSEVINEMIDMIVSGYYTPHCILSKASNGSHLMDISNEYILEYLYDTIGMNHIYDVDDVDEDGVLLKLPLWKKSI